MQSYTNTASPGLAIPFHLRPVSGIVCLEVKEMKFALTGGDGRFVRLCRLLRADGHEVRPFALEKELPDSAETAAEALDGADCLILPLPCLRGGRLNAPFSAIEHSAWDILRHAAPGTVVCAGMAGELRSKCENLGLPLYDYFEREDFALANALLTAEGCITLLLTESERSLHGARILICGFGRIGKMLAPRLLALGARVTVAVRSGEALAWARSMGCGTLRLGRDIPGGDYDFAINTIPAAIFGPSELERLCPTHLIELASAPYGFDADAAARLGMPLTRAPGLPGKCAPESAAGAVRDSIYAILEESK